MSLRTLPWLMILAIELDLRKPSMLHGKKGFERIVWAFKNVLNGAVTWLFYDFGTKNDVCSTASRKKTLLTSCIWVESATQGFSLPLFALGTSPLSKHHPVTAASGPLSVRTAPLAIPDSLNSNDFEAWSTDDLEDHALQISEWLGLVSLQSPRVHHDDQIDPYLCRYSKPDGDPPRTKKLVLLSWSGLIPAEWLRQLFIALV